MAVTAFGQPSNPLDNQRAMFSTKTKNRPNPLNLAPFDPGELSHRLSLAVTQDVEHIDPTETAWTQPRDAPQVSQISPHLKDRKASVVSSNGSSLGDVSPRRVRRFSKAHTDGKHSTASSRRGSFLDRFTIKGANYTHEEEQPLPSPTPYRHVPKHAASQFARTTTAGKISQKVPPQPANQSPKSVPNSGTSSTMCPYEHNQLYRRAQSFCTVKPYERNQVTVLEPTVEVDEVNAPTNSQSVIQTPVWNKGFDLGGASARRMSTGGLSAGTAPYRRGSNGSSVFRQDSDSSSQRDSAQASPFREEFDLLRRGSTTGRSSRSGSISSSQRAALVETHRVDWTQSDECKKEGPRWAWRRRSRVASHIEKDYSQEEVVEVDPRAISPGEPPKSAKFLSRFKH